MTTDAFRDYPVEARITRKVVRALRDAGTPVVSVYDGEEYVEVKSTKDVLDRVFNLDDSYLFTASGSWVRLIGGNEWDMLTDYTVSLEPALESVNAWIEKNNS